MFWLLSCVFMSQYRLYRQGPMPCGQNQRFYNGILKFPFVFLYELLCIFIEITSFFIDFREIVFTFLLLESWPGRVTQHFGYVVISTEAKEFIFEGFRYIIPKPRELTRFHGNNKRKIPFVLVI